MWLLALAGATYIGSVAIIVAIVTAVPVVSWTKAFRIVGLALSAAGAVIALSPRVMRTREQVERELSMFDGRERLWRDTLIARYGLLALAIGFIQQLVAALIS